MLGKSLLWESSLIFLSGYPTVWVAISQVSSLRLSSGHLGLVLYPKHSSHASLSSPSSLVVDTSIWATSALWVVVRSLFCGFCFFFFPGYVPLWDSKTPHRPTNERLSFCLETSSFKTPCPGWVSLINSFVSLFIFYILSYLLWKRMGCLSGCLMSSTSVQKLFCGSCSAFKWFFDEFVGEKVVSLS